MRLLQTQMDDFSSQLSGKLFEVNAMVARDRMADPSMINHPSFMPFMPGVDPEPV